MILLSLRAAIFNFVDILVLRLVVCTTTHEISGLETEGPIFKKLNM